MKVEITEELLKDIQHVVSWYQGRKVDRAVNVGKWAEEALQKHHMEIEMIRIMKEFRQAEKDWLSQFKKGDIWKPKAWKCKKLLQKYCEYKPYDDPTCDGCIHCHHPYERK